MIGFMLTSLNVVQFLELQQEDAQQHAYVNGNTFFDTLTNSNT